MLPGYVNAPPPPMAAAGDALLTNTAWAWQGTQMQDGSRIVPDAPERYTLTFQPRRPGQRARRLQPRLRELPPRRHRAVVRARCRCTKMMCTPGSRDSEFLQELAAVTGQRFSGDELVLTLQGNAGTMRFTTPRQ